MVTRTIIKARKVAVIDKTGNVISMKEIAGDGSVTKAEKKMIAEELDVKTSEISVAIVDNITSKYAISDADFLRNAVCIDGMGKEEIKKAINE